MREISSTGLETQILVEDGKLKIHYSQDVAPSLDHATGLRNAPEYSRAGIKANLWHCVHVPEVVVMQMLVEDGFDAIKASASELRQFLTRNRAKYSRLFVTAGQL